MNREIRKSGVDYTKKIEYAISKHKNIIDCGPLQKAVYNEILDLLGAESGPVGQAPVSSVFRPAEDKNKSTLADAFAVRNIPMHTAPPTVVTPAEREDYNRVIFYFYMYIMVF